MELLVVLLYLGHFSGCFFYLLSTPPYQTAIEKRLIDQGEMETWVTRSFGGDRLILVPAVQPAPATAFNASVAPVPARWAPPDFANNRRARTGRNPP